MRHKLMPKPVLLVLKTDGGRDVRALSAYPLCWAETVFSGRGESAIPALDTLTKRLRAQGVEEMVIGMAHRGRLNVLVNLLNKDPAQLLLSLKASRRSAVVQAM